MTEPGSATSPAPVPGPGIYRLDPERSIIRVSARAMFGLMPVHGTFRLLSGEVRIADDLAQCAVRATIDAASFDSGLRVRDRDVVSAALLDASAYPEITFAASGARPAGPGWPGGPDGSAGPGGSGAGAGGAGWLMAGTVTAHGVTSTVELIIGEAQVRDGVVRFRATATLDRTRFGFTHKLAMVSRTVDLIIEAADGPGEETSG